MTTSFIETGRTLPYIAHVYTNAWKWGNNNAATFKKLLGPLVDNPTISFAVNGGHQPVELQVRAQDTSAQAPIPGDIITLTQQDGDGSVIYTGEVIDAPDSYDTKVEHKIQLAPLSIELGLTPFFTVYTATDPAQMWRDAIALTKHLVGNTAVAPNTGVTRAYDFSATGTALHVAQEVIKLVGNPNYYTFIDEVGQAWMGVGSTAGAATYTVKRGQHYTARKTVAPITKLYNYFGVIGGVIPSTSPEDSYAVVYDNGHIIPCTFRTMPPPSYAAGYSGASSYGVRARMPHFRFPKLVDQATLNNIATTLGAALNRRQTQVEITLTNFAQRINLATATGATMRYFDPSSTDGVLSSGATSGAYSPTYLITQVDIKGPVQKVILTDLIPATRSQVSETHKILELMMAQAGSAISSDGIGVIAPGNIVGGVSGGPNSPTTPNFYA